MTRTMPVPLIDVGFEIVLTEQLRFIMNLGAAVGAALIGGAVATRLGQPAIIGYILAGVAIGPLTPGFVGNLEQIRVLADVGVILLLFALGVQFSLRELTAVRRVALGAGGLQILGVLTMGTATSALLGFNLQAALVAGAALSISSTLVVLKWLIARGELDSLHGRAAIGWSIVQDVATIVFIVSLPPLAGADPIGPFVGALAKVVIFLALAYFVGTRALPWLFLTISRLGSSELFLLAVVATALLTAFLSSAIFGLSLALGAFVAGLIVSESELSYQAAAEVIPFRDLFAVLFFVSVGMLVDPGALAREAPLVVLFVVIAVLGKGALSAALGRAFGLPARSALLLGAILGQVGEFSFLLAENARQLGIFDDAAYNVILGTAVVSIILSPLVARASARGVVRWERRVDRLEQLAAMRWAAEQAGSARQAAGSGGAVQVAAGGEEAGRVAAEQAGAGQLATDASAARLGPAVESSRSGAEGPGLAYGPTPGRAPVWRSERALVASGEERLSVVVLGGGRVGRLVIRAVRARGFGCTVIDRDRNRLEEVAKLGVGTLYGDAANPEILRRAGLDRARVLVVAIGDRLTARLATERALRLNPELVIASRVRGPREADELRAMGVRRFADPDAEAAFELARHALQRMGVSGAELSAIVTGLRRDAYGL